MQIYYLGLWFTVKFFNILKKKNTYAFVYSKH